MSTVINEMAYGLGYIEIFTKIIIGARIPKLRTHLCISMTSRIIALFRNDTKTVAYSDRQLNFIDDLSAYYLLLVLESKRVLRIFEILLI